MNIKLLTAIGMVNRRVRKTIITYPDADRWCNKLIRHLKISRKMAEKIACSKLIYFAKNYKNLVKYKAKCINEPLEAIKSTDHALSIFYAYIRHNETDYDKNLHELRALENIGILKESTHKNIARKGISLNDVLRVLDNDDADLNEPIITYIRNRLT